MPITRKLIVLFASAALGVGAIAPAFAQTDTGATGAAASAAKPTKEQRKQARKEARAKKTGPPASECGFPGHATADLAGGESWAAGEKGKQPRLRLTIFLFLFLIPSFLFKLQI